MTGLTRRGLVGAGLAAASAAQAASTAAAVSASASASASARPIDWSAVAAQFDVTSEVVQLENGNFGMMARPVLEAYGRQTAMVNRRNSFYARREFNADVERARARVAADLGVATDEIAFTRGATEALQALIGGYGRLRPGDAVLYADHDYDSLQVAMRWLKTRRGVDVVTLDLPSPATHQGLIDAYDAVLAANPRIRLMLLTQVSHRDGLVLPVAEIIAAARQRHVDVILDSAHAWGQVPLDLRALGADFVGLNGHKWIGAPVGVGVAYVRKARIADIEPFMGGEEYGPDDVRSRVHTGTANFAAFLTVPDALDFHQTIGAPAKAARLAYLRDLWAEPARALPGVEVLTSLDPRLAAGIGAFRLRGRTSPAENTALARALLERFNIFTVPRTGLAGGACIRVTPGVFTAEADMLKLADALRRLGAG